MPRVYEALGSVLAIYVTLDELIMQNRSISNSWNSYKQMLFVINRNPANFNVQARRMHACMPAHTHVR